jgi:hypothetical protein
VLARERERDPEGFRSEYLAEFVGGGAAYLDPERVADAVADRGELLPDQATGWVAGLDPGFASDPLGLALVGRVPPDLTQLPATLPAPPDRLVLGLARAWKPARHKATSFEERRAVEDRVVAEVADVCLRYRAAVVTDQFCAPAVVDALRRRGLNVWATPMTAASKTAAFEWRRIREAGGPTHRAARVLDAAARMRHGPPHSWRRAERPRPRTGLAGRVRRRLGFSVPWPQRHSPRSCRTAPRASPRVRCRGLEVRSGQRRLP